jgi:hypothetical protein
MTATQSWCAGRRIGAIAAAVVLAAALLTIGGTARADGDHHHPPAGKLVIESVTDQATGVLGAVQGEPFDVVVTVRDSQGNPRPVSRATVVILVEVVGDGQLGGVGFAVIPAGSATATISAATYSLAQNGVELRAKAVLGERLAPSDPFPIDVVVSAVSALATPGVPLNLIDPACLAPTPGIATCGFLKLGNGASGLVTMSIGLCEGIEGAECRESGKVEGLLVTALADLKDDGDPLYTKDRPAQLVVACDKTLCGHGGVTSFPVLVDLFNTGDFELAPECPKKGRLGIDQDVCWDTRSSHRDRAGDLHSVILFAIDIRASHP